MAISFHRVGPVFVAFVSTALAQPLQRLSLPEAISIALQNNERILTAQREVDAASARILQAGRIPNPELSVTYNEAPTNFSLGSAGERDIGFTQTIEFPGKRSSRVAAAGHGRAIAELSLKRQEAIVISQVKTAYYKVLLAAEVADNLEYTISLVSDFLAVVTQRYQAGSSGYLDVIRSKVELTRLRNDLAEAGRDYEIRLSELNVLLGRFPEEPVTLTDSLSYSPMQLTEDSAVVFYAEQSAFLQIAAQEVARSQSLLSLAEKSYLPDFTFGAALQKRAGQISPTGFSNYLGFALGVSVPLWFWQGPRGEVQESRAAFDASEIRYLAAQRRVRQSIRAAYRAAQVAETQVKAFETSLLRDVEDELRAGITAYQNNQIDALNLFDIYRTYRAAKIEYVRALYNFSTAVAQLEAAKELPE
ncbi:MAG TPA: TolC family protein [Bacteroidota bacterium]|nr:TolC family protein [Bacteroidota bacterium]